jgi:hypothetical protein
MNVKRMVCLANSIKHKGRCVAGRELIQGSAGGGWIRPVSARPGEELSEGERCYANGQEPRVLDVVELCLERPHVHGCQKENWRIEAGRRWQGVGRITWMELESFVESPETLWPNVQSTYVGKNDELPLAVADAMNSSLVLVKVPRLTLRVWAPKEAFGNPERRVQARFMYRNVPYALWVTDPVVCDEYLRRQNGEHLLMECCVTLSISAPFSKSNGQVCCYKLVAAIIRRDESVWP